MLPSDPKCELTSCPKTVLAKDSDIARTACSICHTWITIQPDINLRLLQPHFDYSTCAVDACDETGLLGIFRMSVG
jgi:hypothetical protein